MCICNQVHMNNIFIKFLFIFSTSSTARLSSRARARVLYTITCVADSGMATDVAWT